MAILYDARGNEIRVGFPDSVTNEVVTDPRPITAVLSALNAEVVIDLNGATTCVFDIRTAAASLTLVFEGMVDGVNPIGLSVFTLGGTIFPLNVSPEEYISSVIISSTMASTYLAAVSSLRRIRVRVSAFTSGTVTIAARASAAPFLVNAKPTPSIEHITATGASGASVTATLPANGAGIFHYITLIHLVQFVVAARTAAATPVIATTTNLPGSPAYSCDATVGAVGQVFVYNFTPIFPLKSFVANLNTTFVAPATTSTIWRWNISFYNGG